MITTRTMINLSMDYQPPLRDLKRGSNLGWQWNITVPATEMQERLEFIMNLDPMLSYEAVASIVLERFGNLSCRFCYSPLVSDGTNGSGTKEYLCKNCNRKMSYYNTFELTSFRYRKELTAFLAYVHCSSAERCSSLYNLGNNLFNELLSSLPMVNYSKKGDPDIIDYEGIRYGIVTIDMMYKGNKGLMLGVSGGLKFGNIGNENTGEGMDAFFDKVEESIQTDKIIFIMDMKMSVAKIILDRWKEKAIIILQSHRIWGDVFVYFYRKEWYTLHIRTDAFSDASVKRDETLLLPPGTVELYEGLKGTSHRNPIRKLSNSELENMARKDIDQIKLVDWNSKGRIDFIMASRMRELNALLKEIIKRKGDVTHLLNDIKDIIKLLKESYRTKINRSTKRKIVNAWRSFDMLQNEVNDLSLTLLKEPLPVKSKKKKESDRKVRLSKPARIKYRGPIDGGPEELRWIIRLLNSIFKEKEITTNYCEGTFGNMGTLIRSGKSIFLERALTKNMLRNFGIAGTVSWFNVNYPINEMGRRGKRGDRKKLIVGKSYRITYSDHSTVKTERTIDIIKRNRKYVLAYCHLRNDIRTFKRSRIKSIIPL